MKSKLYSLFLVALMASCISCEDLDKENEFTPADPEKAAFTPINQSPAAKKMNEQNIGCAWKVFANHENVGKENFLFSPISASCALAMVQNGAEGETAKEIADVLGLSGYSHEEINDYFKTLINGLANEDTSVKFLAANSLWCNQSLTVKDGFKNTLKSAFNAKVTNLDFSSADAAKSINDWCKENTNGLITKMLDRTDPRSLCYLLNAIYYKAMWTEKFQKSETNAEMFYLADGTSFKTDFMHRQSVERYYEDANLQALMLPMGSYSKFDAFFVLPKEGKTVKEIAAKMTANWQDIVQGEHQAMVKMSVPKFTQKESKNSLSDAFKAAGMTLPFSAEAKFPGISDNGYFISDISQSCYFTIDEDKVEAAAVTEVEMKNTSLPSYDFVEMNINRPFIYGLRERSTGVILFVGNIMKPQK